MSLKVLVEKLRLHKCSFNAHYSTFISWETSSPQSHFICILQYQQSTIISSGVSYKKRRFDSLTWDKYINSASLPVCVLKAEFRRGCCERHIPSGCRRLTCRWACSYQFQRLVAARRWERCGGSLRWLSGSEAYPSLQQEGRSQLRYWEAEVVWFISSWYFSQHGRFQYFKLALKTISIFLNPFYKHQWWS